MINLYKDYLEDKLKESGIKSKVFKTEKDLKTTGATHLGAVLFVGEEFEKDGSHKIYIRDDGTKVKRIKKLKRTTKISVIIGDYDEAKCSAIFSNFIGILDDGIDDGNGNFVEIKVEESDWVPEKDSLLKSKMAVQISIEFSGGIYKDIPFTKINEVEITDVEVERS